MGDDSAPGSDDIEALVRLAQDKRFAARVVAVLIRRIVEIQDSAGEAEILALIAEVEALLAEQAAEDWPQV